MSQTAHEFIKTDDRREVYENCDVKAMFYAESVSDQMCDYHTFADSEVDFIQGAARGESAGFSECLLISSEHGRRRLEIRSGPFEHAVLDGGQNPWEWLADTDNATHDANAKRLSADDIDLEETDMPAVMASDRDLELSLEMGRDQSTSPTTGTGHPGNSSPGDRDATDDPTTNRPRTAGGDGATADATIHGDAHGGPSGGE